ncbi:hypothetical protein Leryth_013851 [Lithospermum erythrorhizon]|nr:hypothetical protein Leryth_013851 [Lithospermum erythrorhizon]
MSQIDSIFWKSNYIEVKNLVVLWWWKRPPLARDWGGVVERERKVAVPPIFCVFQVDEIPETFLSTDQYFKSFINPLLSLLICSLLCLGL